MEVSRALCRSPWGTISSILQSSNQFIKVELGEGIALDFGMMSGLWGQGVKRDLSWLFLFVYA